MSERKPGLRGNEIEHKARADDGEGESDDLAISDLEDPIEGAAIPITGAVAAITASTAAASSVAAAAAAAARAPEAGVAATANARPAEAPEDPQPARKAGGGWREREKQFLAVREGRV